MPEKIGRFRHTCVSDPSQKTKSPALAGPSNSIQSSLLQIELDRLFNRMVVARQNSRRGKVAVLTSRIPALAEHRNLLRLDELVLQTLREHPRLAPAPHFLPTSILNVEIVRLPTRETQLHHLRRVVANVQAELDHSPRIHGELGAQRNLRMLFSG